MTWLEDGTLWLVAAIVLFAGAWLRNLLSTFVPGPQRTILALQNLAPKSPSKDRVRVVLAWLANDPNGNNAKAVSASFAEIGGIELCRSARIVSASGAADAWRPAMRRKAKDLLRAWHADIAIVGRVDKDGDALSLWFVNSNDDDTFADAPSNPYALHLNRLPDNFVDHLHVQIRTLVLTLAIPKTTNDSTMHIGLRELATAVPKLENLFRTISAPEDRASLCMIYVLAQSSLGEWLCETHRLRSAIAKAREIIDADRSSAGRAHALLTTRVNLARTLYLLGEREADTTLLEESVSLFDDALREVSEPDGASAAAGIKGLMANALRALADLQRNPEHLDQAARLLESALEIHRLDEETPFVSVSQNNLGLVYLDLARRTRRRDAIERAQSLFDAASTGAKQSALPTLWAMTQNNAGQGHELLAELDPGRHVAELELSRHRYEEAVRGYSETTTPYQSASANTNLARVLTMLGAATDSVPPLDRAIKILRNAHDLYAKNPKLPGTGATVAGLGTALLTRGKLRSSARDVTDAIPWFEQALDAYPLHANPLNWVKIKTHIAISHFELAKTGKDVDRIRLGFSALEAVFAVPDLAVLATFPEPYAAFMQGTDLIDSLHPEPGFVADWIATWVPVFTDREHHNVPSLVLGTIQNNIATICQHQRALADAVKVYRRAIASLATDGNASRHAPDGAATVLPLLAASHAVDANLLPMTKRNLGTALWMLGEVRACVPHLSEAIRLFEEVLAGQDRDADPMEWAITQSGRAKAYKELYVVDGDVELLRRSLSAYDEAVAALPDGMDTPWHQQVPGKRQAVIQMLRDATRPSGPSS